MTALRVLARPARVSRARRIADVAPALIDDIAIVPVGDGFRAEARSGGAVVERAPVFATYGGAVGFAVEKWGQATR